jgi:hypothetical protein
MEETTPKELTPQDIEQMGYSDLVKLAKERNINFSGLNPRQLKFALGAAPEGAVVVDLAEGMSDDLLEKLKEEKRLVPGKMIYTKDIEDAVWRTREYNPVAFDNVNFTDRESLIQHVFNKRTKCSCGETVVMERKIKQRKDKQEIEVVDPSPIYKKQCKCGKWYIYHTKEDYETHGPIL